MFFKAISIKVLVASLSMYSLLSAGERFKVVNKGMNKIGDTSLSRVFFVYLKVDSEEHHVYWAPAHDDVKSWETDRVNRNILHLEFNDGSKTSVDMTRYVLSYYR